MGLRLARLGGLIGEQIWGYGINNQLFIMLGVSSQPEEGLLGLSVRGARVPRTVMISVGRINGQRI